MALDDDIQGYNDDSDKLRALLLQARRARQSADQMNANLIERVTELEKALDIVDATTTLSLDLSLIHI